MKITDVEAIYVRQAEVKERADSGQDAILIKVHTDAGITGIGEVDSAPLAVKGYIEGPYSHSVCKGLKHILIGQDPFQTEYLWHRMYDENVYVGRRGPAIHAMAGIDLALWDIKGKALQMPVWRLLGGGFHQKIRCYASSLFGNTPAETRTLAKRICEESFGAVKFGWGPMGQNEKQDIELVAEARAGVGSQVDLMIDAGLAWDGRTAIRRAKAFAEYGIFWLEEPVRPDDYEGYRKLSAATDIYIAAGEHESHHQTFIELMDRGRIDIVQVDLARCGITEAMKIASLAHDRGLKVANHGFSTYINVAAALHWLNAVPNALMAEFVVQESTNLRERITHQKLRAVDGYLAVPQDPGLGIDLDEEQIARLRV
jgi:L-rhamnonate dehydratase